ncbi:otogelin isoform X2 [Cynoglossus semilaevis]|uniref:otogelin isoform X2 n=1 Tax=Cynoglossus semilaevis TaxID=244447 RepID=UPI000D62E3F0|nr:otogelin isoform X2 [Cynoglossus semilaevis]
MDHYLGRSWKRLFRSLSLFFVFIYQAHISWCAERVNVSHRNAFNSGRSSIKQQKWDTASQGVQDLQQTSAGLENNTSSSKHPVVSWTATYKLTSSSTERTLTSSWTLNFNQTHGNSVNSSQMQSRAVSSGNITPPSKLHTATTSTKPSPVHTQVSTSHKSPRRTEVSSQSSTSTTSASTVTRQSTSSTATLTQSQTVTSVPKTTLENNEDPRNSPSDASPTSKHILQSSPRSQTTSTMTPVSSSANDAASQSSSTSSSKNFMESTSVLLMSNLRTPVREAGNHAIQSLSSTTATRQSSTPSQSPAATIKDSQLLISSYLPTNTIPSSQSTTRNSQTTTTESFQSQTSTTPVNLSPTNKTPTSQSPTTRKPVKQTPTATTPISQTSVWTTPTSEPSRSTALVSQSDKTTASVNKPSRATVPVSQSPHINKPPILKPILKTFSDHPAGGTMKTYQSSSTSTQQSPTTVMGGLNQSSHKLTHSQSSSSVFPEHPSKTTSQTPISSSNNSQSSNYTSSSETMSAEEQQVDTLLLNKQGKEVVKMSLRRGSDSCTFPCLNGGQCVQSESCDCSLYQATGRRCQTVPNPGFEREMTCRSWAQYNFETFDGLYYFFPGRCTYTLLKDCEDTSQANVVVQVHNDPECGSTPYTCQRSVSLFLPWEGEVRLYSNNVTFKGQRLQLPHHIHDLQLEQISQYVLVTQHQGFTLAWDGGSGSVYIKLSPEFVGRTCGMCGNFNADVQDDLKTSYGVLTNEIELFGNSWLETEPHQSQCSTVPPGFSSPCSAVSAQVLLKVKEVCAMLLDPPFQSCHDFVSPLSYMASCSNDLCMSNPSGDAVCQVFTEYARACAHADHTLHDWRHHIPQCEKQCPAGLQYRECISCCPDSCSLERTCIDSKLTCLDGCYCPDGLIYEDGRCVTPSDCPCEYHGMFYPSGQTLQEECNNCTCVGGMWNCTDHSCPGECSVTGDMYFQSFDGRLFTFPATCQYVLAKSRNSGRFTITIQNSPCGANLDGACIQSVNLVVDEDPKSEITLSHVGEVFMAGQYRISLPYSDDVFLVQELSSMFLQVKTTFGLRLQYSWKDFRLYLQADERWKDDTVGLCGTFNGNIQDDFLSPSGMIESTPQLFGNAWRVSSACSNSLSSPQLDPCDTHQQAVTYASGMCDILNQDLFSACHEFLSPAPFHQQCRSDTCKCGTPCLCSALAHYARNCRRFSVIVDFRSHVSDCAVTCPANMQYGTCVSSCQSRCSALSVPQHCGEECEEGCVCPQGSFYSHRTHTCVQRSECPCSFLGADYEPGDVIMTSAGVQLCLNGKLVSQTTNSDRLCPAGQLYQDCSEGEDGFLSGRGVACELTCESYLLNLTCSTHEPCVAGCTCPPGLLRHGDECFEPVACPCLWKGKEYYPGDRVSAPCHDCVCQHGTFQCVFRPCPSMCTAYGDRHYRTFDGLLFDYVGACKVFLVKSSEGMPLSVTAENINCFESGFICRKSLVVTVGQSSIAIDEDNGNPNPSSVIDKKHRMFIWPAGYFTVIHFPDEDITVLWDRKTTVHVQVGPRWQGKLSGLCGNFDMKTVNEMRTPDNIDSPTSQEFGSSWTAAECVNSADIRHPCSLSPLREPFAKRQCAVLLSEVFQACHLVVDVTWFYMNCLSDTCACSRGGDCECFCTSVAAYAQRCCHQGVPVDWRSPSLCPYDCEYYNKVLGKGPFRLIPFRDQSTVLAASRSSGSVFFQRGNITSSSTSDIMSHFMMTPGLSRARPHDTSRLSFEAVDRPNYFLYASPDGQVKLAKWEESEAFWDGATFVLHRNTWIFGYSSLESHAKSGFFLHTMLPRLHLLKYRHTDSFRKATLFRLTGSSSEAPPQPLCQWRYESCISPCFKTCSDPWAEACVSIPEVEGCIPVCPPHMVLDEVTRRCVHVEDCINIPVVLKPPTPSSPQSTSAVTSSTAASSPLSSTVVLTKPSTAPHTGPITKFTSTLPVVVSTQTPSTTTPTVSDKLTQPDTTSSPPSPQLSTTPRTVAPPVWTEVVEQSSTVEVSTASSTVSARTRQTSTISPSDRSSPRTSSAPLTSTTWITSTTRPTDQWRPFITTTATTVQTTTPTTITTTSTEQPVTTSASPRHENTTKATTHSPAAILTTSGTAGVLISHTTTSPTDTRTKFPSEGRLTQTTTAPTSPDWWNTNLTTVSPLQPVSLVETETVPLPSATSAKTTKSFTPVAPFTTSKTTTPVRPTVPPSTSDKIPFTTSTKQTTSITSKPELPSSPRLTTTTATSRRTVRPTEEAHVPATSASEISPHSVTTTTASTTVSQERTDTTSSHTEKTSWSTMVPTTNSTTKTTISRSSVFPEVFTTTKGLPVTTELRERPEAHTETTREPHTPSTERITHATSTTPSEHWRTTPQVTTSTPVHRPTVTMKEEEVTSTETTKVPKLSHPTTEKTVTSVTSQASTHYTTHTETSSETSAVEIVATTTTAWVIPPTTIPSAPKTTHTTATTRPSSGVITTIRPVVIQPVTETIHPLTGRVQMSTTTTTIPPTTTTSAILKPTSPERVTTRLVSTIRATPSTTTTTTKPTTTLRTTPSLPVTTRVTPRTPVTERSTIKPLTTRVTEATRTPVVPTRSTSPQPPTVTPSPGTTTVAVTVPTSTVSVTTTSTAEPADDITTAPVLTTVPAVVPVPTLTTAASSTPTPTHASRGTVSSVRPTTSTDTDMSPSASHLTTPTPEGIITTTHEHRTPSSSTIPGTMTTTTTRITEPHGVNHTSPDATLPSKTTTSHALPETTRHTDKDTTSIPVAPTGICSPPYAEIVDECTKYICVNNQLILFNKSQSCPFTSEPPNCGLLGLAVQVNGDKCCPQWDCPCRCSMFPDLSLITFDGNSVAVYKAASYIVMQLPNETISVLVQECPADSESPIIWNFTNLCLVALNITHQSNSIVINRLQRRLYVNTRYAKPRFKKYGFEIYDTGNMYLIRSPAGLGLQWYHSTGMMIIETDNYSNKLSTLGLCGVCDGDPSNDLTLANGTTVGVGEDPALFIDSWQVPNTTSYISQSRRRELNCSTSDCSSCMAMLQNPAFHPCHEFVSPDTFCEIWIKDAEYVNNQCVALAAYVASCHKFNICIEWRRPDYCPFVCPDALRYQACLPACTSQSCTNHDFDSDPEKCSGLTEGCVCPEGTLLHRPYSALCISPEKCACTDGSGIPHANGEVWKASKDACCMYRCENDTIIPLEYNCSSVAAPVCHRAGQTVISLADDSSCCPQKICVCNQSLCDPSPPVCKYGEKLVSYYRQDSCCPYFVCECDSELCESAVPTCREDQTLISTRADNSCCLAHICMCASSCPQTPPLCQEGEVLTIDRNSTDRCCPIYQCVCERYRCSQPSCPVGMSVASVAVPGRCCPNQTCECSCEKIASPKCGLGEAAQLDRHFTLDPQNQCSCKRYKCVPEAVCVFGERGVLRPGQTLVEHGDDGLCHSRQCSRSLDPASGFHLLRTSSMNCSTHCLPNQIYIPPRDQSTCCGVCKNISCIYEHENGTAALYKPGRSWVSNCMKFDCADTLSGATLISYPFSCPPFNETECMKIGGSVVSYMDGCCKTCKEDGKSCQKVTVRMTIRKNDCRSNRPVNIVSCDGKCPSASIYNYNINTYARFCKCCRETGLQRRSVQLYCSSNSTWVSYSIQEPTDCSCQWS